MRQTPVFQRRFMVSIRAPIGATESIMGEGARTVNDCLPKKPLDRLTLTD